MKKDLVDASIHDPADTPGPGSLLAWKTVKDATDDSGLGGDQWGSLHLYGPLCQPGIRGWNPGWAFVLATAPDQSPMPRPRAITPAIFLMLSWGNERITSLVFLYE